jgi:hypothetical protein
MPVNLMPAQNVGQFVDAAYQAGYANTVRSDRRFASQQEQQDRQFYDRMRFADYQNERNYEQQLGYLDAQTQANFEYQKRRMLDQIETEQANTQWEYTQEDQRRLKQVDEAERKFDEMVASEPQAYDPHTIRDMKWQFHQRRAGVQPMALPKKDPWEGLPIVTKDGKQYRRVEGRNGRPEFVPEDPNEIDPQEAAKLRFQAELDAPKLEVQAAKEAATAAKQAMQFSRQQKMDAQKMLMEMRTATVKKDGMDVRAFTDDDVKQFMQENADALSGIVDVSTPAEAMALPPGTRFRTPDGRTKIRP